MARDGAKLRSAKWRKSALERHVYPTLGSRPIAEIRRSEIVRLLDGIEETSGSAMATLTLAIIRKVMNWHASRTDDFVSPIVRGMARTQEKARDRVLSDDELLKVWSNGNGVFGAYVRFLLLTAARRNEAALMTWAEIEGSDWTLPATRNKAGVDLVRPLSRAARQILEAQPQRLMSRAGVPSDHAERCLGHVIGGVRGVYDRHEYHAEKQQAFEALAGIIERIVTGTQAGVVQLKGRRK
jgi:integrase